jgi:glycerophosphoryl diester phosphodiesterase
MNPPIAFAHRGARAHAPENTLPAFTLALRLGATGLESDVWMTADGVAVLDHDGVVRTGLRKKPISEIMAKTLPQHIPTFDEFISSLDKTAHVSLDIKDLQAFEPVCLSASNVGFP